MEDVGVVVGIGMEYVGIAMIVWALWTAICNWITSHQRSEIIEVIFRIDDPSDPWAWKTAADAYDNVPYERHLLFVMFLHSPRKLYPEVIWERMGWRR